MNMPMSENRVRFLLIDLKRAGFHAAAFDEEKGRIVPIPENPDLWIDGHGVCFKEGASQETRDLAHGPMTDIYRQAKEMLRSWENSHPMEIADVHNFRILAEFSDVVLAARDDGPHGLHFVTWDYDPGHTGVGNGHYTTSYADAKEDFATRAGLIDQDRLFEPEELKTLHRALSYQRAMDVYMTLEQEKLSGALVNRLEQISPELKLAEYIYQDVPDEAMDATDPRVDAFSPEYEDIEFFGKSALFTDERVKHASVPDGFYAYELRSGADGEPNTVETYVAVDFAGTVITQEPLDIGDEDYIYLGTPGSDDYAITSMGTANSLDEFQYQTHPSKKPRSRGSRCERGKEGAA